uniref:Si:dkey-35i13.1 n=1 Tax=Oryzias latipes TaxID=8090 RepID=A0A3P9I9K7_ORYLA
MTARTVEASGMSVHRCHGGFQASNGTCAEQLSLFPPFSSTLALLVLVAVLVGIILVSLATFHFHKRKLQNRKIQRAQEEYERDSRSPTRVGARGEPARPCVIVRPELVGKKSVMINTSPHLRLEKFPICAGQYESRKIKTFLKVKA